MTKRTDEEKVTSAPIVVTLGGKEHKIAPLVIRDSREWRNKVGLWKAALSKYASVNSDDPEAFEKALKELMVDRIDQTMDYFFEYARDLNRDEIEAIATPKEVVKAFDEVFKVAFPFD